MLQIFRYFIYTNKMYMLIYHGYAHLHCAHLQILQNTVSFIGLFCRTLLQNIVSFIGLFCERDL